MNHSLLNIINKKLSIGPVGYILKLDIYINTMWTSIYNKRNYHKFLQNDNLRRFLLSAEDKILVETSPYDGVWGVKMSASDK